MREVLARPIAPSFTLWWAAELLIRRAEGRLGRYPAAVRRVYGEMVNLLWREWKLRGAASLGAAVETRSSSSTAPRFVLRATRSRPEAPPLARLARPQLHSAPDPPFAGSAD
jgi:hypothetical protein